MIKKTKMIAHRGLSGIYPDNTEIAFLKAAANGSDGAETDVRITSDGEFVLCHNPEAVFADGTELTVEQNTLARLTEKPLKNSKTDDAVYLCTLKRYLEIMRENDMICFIELKGDYTRGQIKEVYDLIAREYSLDRCIIQSFEFGNLLLSREYVPGIPIMLTHGSGEAHLGYERCFDGNFSIDAEYSLADEKMVEDFHARGLEVAVWTVNDRQVLEKMKALGVDYIESDYFGNEK